jgi:hypothetical protein
MHSCLPAIAGLPADIAGSPAAGLPANDVGSLHPFLLTCSQREPAVAVSATYCKRPLRREAGFIQKDYSDWSHAITCESRRSSRQMVHAIVWVDVIKANRAYFQET